MLLKRAFYVLLFFPALKHWRAFCPVGRFDVSGWFVSTRAVKCASMCAKTMLVLKAVSMCEYATPSDSGKLTSRTRIESRSISIYLVLATYKSYCVLTTTRAICVDRVLHRTRLCTSTVHGHFTDSPTSQDYFVETFSQELLPAYKSIVVRRS